MLLQITSGIPSLSISHPPLRAPRGEQHQKSKAGGPERQLLVKGWEGG